MRGKILKKKFDSWANFMLHHFMHEERDGFMHEERDGKQKKNEPLPTFPGWQGNDSQTAILSRHENLMNLKKKFQWAPPSNLSQLSPTNKNCQYPQVRDILK